MKITAGGQWSCDARQANRSVNRWSRSPVSVKKSSGLDFSTDRRDLDAARPAHPTKFDDADGGERAQPYDAV